MEETIHWVGFTVLVVLLLVLDLAVFHRKTHKIKVNEALWTSAFWIALSLLFNVFVYYWKGRAAGVEFLTGYLIEKSLSVDNLFVFLIIFQFFKVPDQYQHKVLFWGILGALFFRALFILTGVELIKNFEFTLYILGLFLVYAGVKLVTGKDEEYDPSKSVILKIARRVFPVTDTYRGDKFFVVEKGIRYATPLFIVVVLIETTDIVFALDSIPAILAVSTDSFIVFSSNIFAILGLRALYFALAGIMNLFHYLKYGLAVILSFIGVKILIHHWFEISDMASLVVVGALLFLSVILSLIFPLKQQPPVTVTGLDGIPPSSENGSSDHSPVSESESSGK